MAFTLSLNGTVLEATVTGGSEASPNLASALADAIVADSNATIAAKAYRSGDLMWFEELKLIINSSGWFKWDDDAKIELRTDFQSNPQDESSSNANDGGSIIFGLRSSLSVKVSVRRFDSACLAIGTGGTLIFERDKHGQNPSIVKDSTNRNDYPTFNRTKSPARVRLEGLSYKVVEGTNSGSQKWYFGLSRNASNDDIFANLNLSGGGEIFQVAYTTYDSPIVPQFKVVGDINDNIVRILNGNFNTDGANNKSFNGSLRKARVYIDSPTFPAAGSGQEWNGNSVNTFDSNTNGSHLALRWNQELNVTDGTSAISDASVRITTKVHVAGEGYDLSLIQESSDQQDVGIDATTSGSTLSWNLIDTFKARNTAGHGDTTGATEKYKYDMQVRKYESVGNDYIFQNRIYGYGGLLSNASNTAILTPDANVGTITKNSAEGLADINNANEFYASAKWYWVHSDNFVTPSMYISRAGNLIDAGAFDVDIDATAEFAFDLTGNKITISCPSFVGNMVTTGVITLVNGATFIGSRTDANGTVAPANAVSITNIVAGSRLQIYNVTTATEVVNIINSGTAYSATYDEGVGYTTGNTIRVRLAALGKAEYSINAIAGANGWSILADQVEDTVYTAFGLNGSTVTGFVADYTDDEVDITVAADFSSTNFYAWWNYNTTTEQGIREFFGAVTALNQANIRFNVSVVDLHLDNITSTNLKQLDNRRLYRSDDAYPIKAPTTGGGGLDVVWRNTILTVEVGGSGLTSAESSKLLALDTTNLDAAVSSRSTFDPASDAVANVTLVDTTTTNSDLDAVKVNTGLIPALL